MAGSATTLDEFKARLPILDVVARRVKLARRSRGDHWGCCPFHKEKSPSFHVREQDGTYHCFGCGAHGNAIDFVMALDGLEFPEALERLAEMTGIPAPRREGASAAPRVDRSLYDANEAAVRWLEERLMAPTGARALAYLERRGLDRATIRRFRLGYAPPERTALKQALVQAGFSEAQLVEAGLLARPEGGGDSFDRFRDRVMFPIADQRGRTLGFGGRALGEAKAKYLNTAETPLFHKGELLYNLARGGEAARKSKSLVVAEGYMDVIALDRAGIEAAVAPLGTAVTEAQLQLLWKLTDEPVLCLDGDEAGLRAAGRAALRALPLLLPGKSLRFALLPAGEDPDSLLQRQGAEALRAVVEGGMPLIDFLWAQHVGGQPLDTPERRAALERQLLGAVATIGEASVREHYRRSLRDRLWQLWRSQRPVVGQGRRPPMPARATGGPPRLGDQEVARQQERRLMLPILSQPALLDHVLEELELAWFQDEGCERLRQELIQWHHLVADGAATTLAAHLAAAGLDDLLDGTAPAPANAWSVRRHGGGEDAEALLAVLRRRRERQSRDAEVADLEEAAACVDDWARGFSRIGAILAPVAEEGSEEPPQHHGS